MTERTLVILRHAKAERPGDPPDVERPLTTRGHADATAAGTWRASHDLYPDLVLCSPARRARQTWDAVATALAAASTGPAGTGPAGTGPAGTGPAGTEPTGTEPAGTEPAGTGPEQPTPVRYESGLYDSGAQALLRLIQQAPPQANTVLVVGHNPTLSLLSAMLDPAGPAASAGLATSGIAVHTVPGGWPTLHPGGATQRAAHTARG